MHNLFLLFSRVFVLSILLLCAFNAAKASSESSLEDIRAAKQIAWREGRELHLLFGAGPTEAHIEELVAREQAREKQEVSTGHPTPFRSPMRIFFTNDGRLKDVKSSPRAPLFFCDFNIVENLMELSGALTLNKKETFRGCVDKIYFDISVLKFVKWYPFHLFRIANMLKSDGALYFPEVRLASECTFLNPNMTEAELAPLTRQAEIYGQIRQFVNAFPSHSDPNNSKSGFVVWGGGLSMAEKINGKEYFWCGQSFVNDVFYTSAEPSASDRFKRLIGPLKIEKSNPGDAYPDLGYRSGFPTPLVNNYVKVTSTNPGDVASQRLFHLGFDQQFPFTFTGCSGPEQTHRWNDGNKVVFNVPMRDAKGQNSNPTRISFFNTYSLVVPGRPQFVSVLLNGKPMEHLQDVEYHVQLNNRTIDVDIPSDYYGASAMIEFLFKNPTSPSELNINADIRILGLAFKEILFLYPKSK